MKKLIIAAAVAAACGEAKSQAEDLFSGTADIASSASGLEKNALQVSEVISEVRDEDKSVQDIDESTKPGSDFHQGQEKNPENANEDAEEQSADSEIFTIDLREEKLDAGDSGKPEHDAGADAKTDAEAFQDAQNCPDEDVYGDCEDYGGDQGIHPQSIGENPGAGNLSLHKEEKGKGRTSAGNGWAPKSMIHGTPSDLPTLPEAEVMPIARGHLNRIITPFEKPEAKTSADVSIEIRGSVAYITADTPQPFTVYFTETGDEETALTAHFMAVAGMPSPIDLRKKMPKKARNSIDAEGYAEKLAAGMAAAAAGKTPSGFEKTDEFKTAPCRFRGVSVSGSLAYFESADYTISVHEARMTEKTAVILDDVACDKKAAAVGFYPLHELRNIGDATLIIAARKKED